MITDLRKVHNLETMLKYFANNLGWNVDMDYIEEIEDLLFDYKPELVGLTDEYYAKIKSVNQIRPLIEDQPWGIFAIEFDSNHFEVSALRKVLSGLIPKSRNAAHAMWDKKNLLFLCFWGNADNRTVAVAHFEDKEAGLPQIKVIYRTPNVEGAGQLELFKHELDNLAWPSDPTDHDAWQKKWAKAFPAPYRQHIKESATLTSKLAEVALQIKSKILEAIKVETLNGYVHLLLEKFRNTLIHDMTETQFADMYAQTIVYGLFTARCMNTGEQFDPNDAIDNIPNTNPFLKTLLKDCLAQNNKYMAFDELDLDDVVEMLKNTDIQGILLDWNRQTGGGKEDPVIYFYEGFLNAYESEQKKRRGVYYTPQPVVNFIVRAVDDILKTEFGIEDGLASTDTKTVNITRDSKRKIDGYYRQVADTEEVPAIQILDPATGTGTFLRQTILQIWENFKAKHKGNPNIKQLWNEYVPKHLLPRLNGFELMMAPYAVAHMKLAMVLKETGYDFSSDDRIKVFLTNSLEEPGDSDMQLKLWEDPLATESLEANREKKNTGINVVLGNPPYSGISANNSEYMRAIVEPYKYIDGVHFREKKHWLQDDYVKFIRYAQTIVEKSGAGIVAFINPHGFIESPTFRCMRWSLIQTFSKLYILDLHGNSNKKEHSPDGSKDENVFDIQQGVSICIFVKNSNVIKANPHSVYHADLFGVRNQKYCFLNENSIFSTSWESVDPKAPYFLFVNKHFSNQNKYESGFSVTELFPIYTTGIVTARDSVVIHFEKHTLLQTIQRFCDKDVGDNDIRKLLFGNKSDGKYLAGDTRGWSLSAARKKIQFNKHENLVKVITYRPFDDRYIYYTPDMVDWGREGIMQNFLTKNNIGLITARSNKSGSCDHFYITRNIMETKCGERTTQSAVFPLYIYEDTIDGAICRPNYNETIITAIRNSIQLDFTPKRNSKVNSNCFNPVDLFDYIYAVLHSPNYREEYKEFLKIDFPRVPYPTDKEMFWKLVALGGELRDLHLLESPLFDDLETGFADNEESFVEKPKYRDNKVYINQTDYFDAVPQIAWEFYIGGYQPAQKWLKDRKGRVLTSEDKKHYRKIIVALTETDRIMQEIDTAFEF